MTEFYKFASENGILTFCLACCLVTVLQSLFNFIRGLVTRTYRLVMVTVRGWPPFHLDADGDWNPLVNKVKGDAKFRGESE